MGRRQAVAVAGAITVLLSLTACVGEPLADREPRQRQAKPRPTVTQGVPQQEWRVTRVVDGDTVVVERGSREVTVRLIGLDTPETVHPSEPVECFGPEATRFAESRLLGRNVALEYDASQGRLDYYGRTLAYVWVLDRSSQGNSSKNNFNLAAIRNGYALEYTYDSPYRWRDAFVRAEDAARDSGLGVWRCPRPGS